MDRRSERTFVMVKPDGVQRGLVGEVFSRFERKGYKSCGVKMLVPSHELLRRHYADLADKPFFPRLVKYVSSGPVVAMCWEGGDAVSNGRKLIGATRPAEAAPGTFRADYCIDVGKNIIHGSDSKEAAQKELAMWFHPNELHHWQKADEDWIYE